VTDLLNFATAKKSRSGKQGERTMPTLKRRGRSKKQDIIESSIDSFEVRHFAEDPLIKENAPLNKKLIKYTDQALEATKAHSGIFPNSDGYFWLWLDEPGLSDSQRKIMRHVDDNEFLQDYIPLIKTHGNFCYTLLGDSTKDWPHSPSQGA
jgi:hypothetical protein